MRRRERGAIGAIVLVILAIVMTVFIASFALRRVTTATGNADDTRAALNVAAEAIDQFASAQRRLPCPADPVADTGIEVLPAPGAATCSFPAGTLPWQTLGLKRDAGYDAWGLKISYRVYTGAKGSLTQPRGVDMSECDLEEPTTGQTTAVIGSFGGLCVSSTNPLLRSTKASQFLHGTTTHEPIEPAPQRGKELALTDMGLSRANVAYIVLSHGATGLGAYTASGVRRELPSAGGDEGNNLGAEGPFTIRQFSDADTSATAMAHFDDLIVYRTLLDIVKSAGLSARDWPEPDPNVTTALTFDAATIAGVTGTTPTAADPLPNSLAFGNATVTAYSGGSTSPALSYDSGSAGGGIAVGGTFFSGGYAFLNSLLTNYGGEYMRIDLSQRARKFAVTFNDIGLTDFNVRFVVDLRFYKANSLVQTIQKARCINGSQLASYSIDAPSDFDRVEIQPRDSPYYGALSAFLVSEIKGCTAAAASCRTDIALAAGSATDCP